MIQLNIFSFYFAFDDIHDSKSNEGRQEKDGGVKGRDGSADELDRETGEEQATVGRTRRKDGG